MIESLGPVGTFLVAVAGLLTAFGAKELITHWVTRRGDKADAVAKDRREVDAVSAQGNLEVLRVLLTETKNRVDGYEAAISELKASHSADIRELKTENRNLERQVNDLRQTLQDYQLGVRVPRGMALLPLRELRGIRERHAGLLEQRWYPGEHEPPEPSSPADGPTINARITRIDSGP